MAQSAVKAIETWIRDSYLQGIYKKKFKKKKLLLQSRGTLEFDAVTADDEIVACISLLSARTGNPETSKEHTKSVQQKAFWMLSLEATPSERLFLFTEPSMYDFIKQEQKKRRFPKEIKIVLIELPEELQPIE
jgi:hypothetical protein